MGLSTIMGHLDDANSDLCFRSLSNLNNQKVTPDELTRECHKRGYETMRNAFLNSMSEHWGWPPGKYGAMIKSHGVSLDEIAIINLAQCPVPDNSYQRHQLKRCWTKWTSQLLTQLQPCVIVAQGTQVLDFLRSRILPVKAKLVEGVHHADRKSNEDKQRRLLRVRETIEECVGDRRQN